MGLRLAVTGVVSAICGWLFATVPAPQVAGVDLVATEIADSQSYFVYRYELTNAAASAWSISSVQIDIGASSGYPANLPATGDISVVAPFPSAGEPHAEVGPITPAGWKAILSPQARLLWTPPLTRSFSGDSVPPGETKSGFGIRSTYLPGITTVEAIPTTESCCRAPSDTTGGERIYPYPPDLAVTGKAIVPRYMPSELDVDLVQSQLSAVCSDPLWIDDASLCAMLADSLQAVEDRLAINNYWGAEGTVWWVRSELWNEQVPEGPVTANAQWLLRPNLDHLDDTWAAGFQQSNARLCASAESEADAYFTVTTTGPDQLVGSTVTIDAEVQGVDEPGSSCQMLWLMALDATEPVVVKIKYDSVTVGSELEEFGWDTPGQTPISGPDSIVTTHDGNMVAYVHFLFVDSPQNH